VTPPSPSAGIPSAASTPLDSVEVVHATSHLLDEGLVAPIGPVTPREEGEIPTNLALGAVSTGPWSRYRRRPDVCSTVCLPTGRAPLATPVRVPPRALPVRRPGRHWISPRGPRALDFAIAVLDGDGDLVETLVGWATEQAAQDHARTLTEIASYRIVPCRAVGTP